MRARALAHFTSAMDIFQIVWPYLRAQISLGHGRATEKWRPERAPLVRAPLSRDYCINDDGKRRAIHQSTLDFRHSRRCLRMFGRT